MQGRRRQAVATSPCTQTGKGRRCQRLPPGFLLCLLSSRALLGQKQDPGTLLPTPWAVMAAPSRSHITALALTPCFPPVAGIPTLIVLDSQGEVITRQGRVEVLNDVECREFPWHPKPVLELTDSNAVQLNEGPCLVLFVGTEQSPDGEGSG